MFSWYRVIKTKRVSFILKALEGFLTTYLQILIIFHPSEINIHEEICNKEAAEKSITYIQRDFIVPRRWYTEQSNLLWDPVIVRANPHVIHADQVLHVVYVIWSREIGGQVLCKHILYVMSKEFKCINEYWIQRTTYQLLKINQSINSSLTIRNQI